VPVYFAQADELADPRLEARADALLSAPERARRDRFRHDADRRMFVAGRVMAKVLVGQALRCGPLDWTWREGAHGRPEIGAPASTVRFNLAHSAGLVVCALASGREVGVDVEDLDRRPPERGVVDRYCAPTEVADINARGEEWNQRFLVYWTLKEAYLKALGLGIAVPLAEIAFGIKGDAGVQIGFLGSLSGTDDRWVFRLLRPTDRHLVAVAASTTDGGSPSLQTRPVRLEELLS